MNIIKKNITKWKNYIQFDFSNIFVIFKNSFYFNISNKKDYLIKFQYLYHFDLNNQIQVKSILMFILNDLLNKIVYIVHYKK